jgi:hypothetical protein
MVGCGNSTSSFEMVEDILIAKVDNIDYSEVIIEQMKTK